MQQLPLDGRDMFANGFEWTTEERALLDRLHEARQPFQYIIHGEARTMYPRNPPTQLSSKD